jgi:hypothetical protein
VAVTLGVGEWLTGILNVAVRVTVIVNEGVVDMLGTCVPETRVGVPVQVGVAVKVGVAVRVYVHVAVYVGDQHIITAFSQFEEAGAAAPAE